MREIMHTGSQFDAEALRLALLAEGIDASVNGRPLRGRALSYTVVVQHDDEYDQAVRIREAIERDAARGTPSRTVHPGFAIGVIVLLLAAWSFLHFRLHVNLALLVTATCALSLVAGLLLVVVWPRGRSKRNH